MYSTINFCQHVFTFIRIIAFMFLIDKLAKRMVTLFMEKKKNQFEGLKRPTVVLTLEEHKAIAHFCIDHDITISEFLKRAGLYFVEKGKVPEEGTKHK